MREHASLLLDHGHPHARQYPLAMLWSEAELVRERINGQHATETVLMQAVINAAMASGKNKKPQKHLEKLLKGLTSGR